LRARAGGGFATIAPACPDKVGVPSVSAAMDGPDLEAASTAVGLYVYGVVRSGVPLSRDLEGVNPAAPVRPLESHDLAALVSEVPAAEFEEAARPRSLDDVARLERTARAHELVLESVLAETAVVPLRCCTVFPAEKQVREMLCRESEVLLDALDRLSYRAEWGVKAFVARGAMEVELAWEIHTRFSAVADEALLNPLQRPESSGHPGEMLLNGIYLVADEEASAFRSVARELVERFGRRGVEIVLTGPCPGCNFVKSSIEAAR
jgi:Gas vesicle synthesis protein GvpL/GvpF